MEGYERMKAGMRLYRGVTEPGSRVNLAKLYAPISPEYHDPAEVKQMLAFDVAFYMGWTGHYVADAAMPLHDSIHHDGWSGDNPKGYTRDPEIHGRFESQYVDLIATSEADIVKHVPKNARYLDDPWQATLQHSLDSRNFVENIYRLDLRGAWRIRRGELRRRQVFAIGGIAGSIDGSDGAIELRFVLHAQTDDDMHFPRRRHRSKPGGLNGEIRQSDPLSGRRDPARRRGLRARRARKTEPNEYQNAPPRRRSPVIEMNAHSDLPFILKTARFY